MEDRETHLYMNGFLSSTSSSNDEDMSSSNSDEQPSTHLSVLAELARQRSSISSTSSDHLNRGRRNGVLLTGNILQSVNAIQVG